uniref:Uncharacterized protein n=1 Tax=Romanomermis culicivorax TaxID=13658 RepID=A0A915IIA4_ROMCU
MSKFKERPLFDNYQSKLQIFNLRLLLKIGVPKSKKENVSKFCMEETKPAQCIYIVIVADNLRADPKNL